MALSCFLPLKNSIQLLLSVFFSLSINIKLTAQIDSVLFIGNSYTYFNALPVLFQNLSNSLGDSVYVGSITQGGYTIQDHANNPQHINKLLEKNWNYFIVQEQSQIPTIDHYFQQLSLPYLAVLNSYFQLHADHCAKVGLFLTWGRRFGGQQCDGNQTYCSVPFVDFGHMQDTLTSRYLQMARSIAAAVHPVGEAWRLALNDTVGLILHATDNSHPNLMGSYLAACTHYASRFGKSPQGGDFPSGIAVEWAHYLQRKAAEAVLNHLALYGIDTAAYPPFQFTLNSLVNPLQFNCQNQQFDGRFQFEYAGRVPSDSLNLVWESFDATGNLVQWQPLNLPMHNRCADTTTVVNFNRPITSQERYFRIRSLPSGGFSANILDTLAEINQQLQVQYGGSCWQEDFRIRPYLSTYDQWHAENQMLQSGWFLERDASQELQQNSTGAPGCAFALLQHFDAPRTLRTPCIQLQAGETYLLQFDLAHHQGDSSSSMGLELVIDTLENLSTAWTIKDYGQAYEPSFRTYTDTFSISLTRPYYLGWKAMAPQLTGSTGKMAIDNVLLREINTACNASVDAIEETRQHATAFLTIAPNPAQNQVRITPIPHISRDNSWELYDAYGRKMTHLLWMDSNGWADVSHLPDGLYYLRVVDAKGKIWVGKLLHLTN